ncbi:MAG: ComEC/Rec2 family competence protein [Candidatus Kapaibacteriales bacterium]
MEFSKLTYYPFLKILLIISFGLIAGIIFKPTLSGILIIASLGILISLLSKNFSMVYFSLLFVSGMILTKNFATIFQLKTTETFASFKGFAYGEVTDVFISEKARSKFLIEGNISYLGNKAESFTALINIYDRDSLLPSLNIGDEISFSGNFRLPRTSKLPTDPDEITSALTSGFLLYGSTTRQNIIYHWKKPNPIVKFQRQVQNFLHLKLLHLFPNENFSLFSALLLGNRKYLPEELYRNFSLSGVAHILALSGFHIGIIFTIVSLIFIPIKNKWLKIFLISISLLFYLFAGGSPPSALRATIMVIAFFFISQMQRHSEIINILAFILIIVLIFFPKMIFSPGFQMSYLSVLSIALFNKRFITLFQKIFPSNSLILKYLLSILSVTISVQILLAPLFAYYFGFFSLASFYINILVIPLFSLSIIYGFLSILLSLIFPTFALYYSSLANFAIDLGKTLINSSSAFFSPFVIQNDYTFIIACIISLSLVLLSFSNNFLDFSIKVITLSLLIYFYNHYLSFNDKRICYVPRKDCVLLTIELPNRNICFVLDKKPRQKPRIDPNIVKYLENKMNNLAIGYTGNIGIAISDYLRSKFKLQRFTIPKDLQIKLSTLLFGNSSLFNQSKEKIWRFE